jgi:hypothetical protein
VEEKINAPTRYTLLFIFLLISYTMEWHGLENHSQMPFQEMSLRSRVFGMLARN